VAVTPFAPRGGTLLGIGFLVAGMLAYGLRAISFGTAVPGDLGDARLNSVILENTYRWMRGLEPSLWSPRFFYPFEHALAFSETMVGSAPVYALFRITGLSREGAFDAWYLTGLALNFAAAWVCLRRTGFGESGAATGAFAYTFALPALAQANHAQLV
jgi:hypothetical protein